MKSSIRFPVLYGLVILAALYLRIPGLSERPMHADEAVNGMKCGEMLEGNYRYDPREFHGPSLALFTCLLNGFLPGKPVEEITETSLRIVPLLFSLFLIAGLYGLRKQFGESWVLTVSALLSVSTLFTYYSRYYIHEMLLVCFSGILLICIIRYEASPKWIWAAGIGIAAGLMHTTKETAVLTWLAILLSILFIRLIFGKNTVQIRLRHAILALSVMICISVLVYSRIFRFPSGIADSWIAYRNFWFRGTGFSVHRQPFTEYVRRLLFFRLNGSVFTEAFIFFPAAYGLIRIFARIRKVPVGQVFLSFYTILLTLLYGLMPYKTPWLALNFWLGWILMAASGLSFILECSSRRIRPILTGLCFAGILHLFCQSVLANGKMASDPKNPWVYAHPDSSIEPIRRTLCAIAGESSSGKEMPIQILYPGHDYWPLPWMLRDFHRIRWYDHVDFEGESAPVILIAPELEPDLIRKLYIIPPPGQRHLYLPLFPEPVAIRPGAPLDGYIKKEMADELEN